MKFPLTLTFRIMAIAPQFAVRDANDRLVFYVKQKLFKLKESVTVFGDEAQRQPVVTINADRVLDISAVYRFEDTNGNRFGAVRRNGMRSFWKADYSVLRGDEAIFHIREESAWVKVMDGMLTEIPILNMLSGYVFHPSYMVTQPDGRPVLRMKKQPAFWESRFRIDRLGPLETEDEALVVLGLMMLTVLERRRG